LRGLTPWHAAMVLGGRLLTRLHTVVVRTSFAAWGAGATLGRGATLVAPSLVSVGVGVTVGERAWLNARDDRGDGEPTLRIGAGTYIGRQVQINAWRSVTIGRDVLIADRVFISDVDHNYAGDDKPIILQGSTFMGAVVLQDGCWIGIGAVILPGVTIGRNAVVAANAVVTQNIPDRCVAGGIPARVIRSPEQAPQ
jgi:serine acetyltransferase